MSAPFKVIEVSMEIGASAAAAFERWTQFEKFPEFMEGVKEVRRLGTRKLRWRGIFAGQSREWDSTIMVWIPARRLAWRATSSGAHSSRVVCVEEVGPQRTRVTVKILIDQCEAWSQAPSPAQVIRRVRANLGRLKTILETRNLRHISPRRE
jgi:uncharacterized membrane protein